MTNAFDLERLFADPNLGVLATVGPGQRPHAMPIWYLYESGLFVMIAGGSSQKADSHVRAMTSCASLLSWAFIISPTPSRDCTAAGANQQTPSHRSVSVSRAEG